MTQVKITEKSKVVSLNVQEVESNAVIVSVDGWRMRVYFEDNSQVLVPRVGQVIQVKYTGDIEDVHSIKFEKLK